VENSLSYKKGGTSFLLERRTTILEKRPFNFRGKSQEIGGRCSPTDGKRPGKISSGRKDSPFWRSLTKEPVERKPVLVHEK